MPSHESPDVDGLVTSDVIDLAALSAPEWPGPVPFNSIQPSPQPMHFDFKVHPGPPRPGFQIAVSTSSAVVCGFVDLDEAIGIALAMIRVASTGAPERLAAATASLVEARSGLVLPGGRS